MTDFISGCGGASLQYSLERNGVSVNNIIDQNNPTKFKPTVSGTYKIIVTPVGGNFTGTDEVENITINVFD